MVIKNLYSKEKARREREEQGLPDIYRYDLPEPLRRQILMIAGDILSPDKWVAVAKALIREHGFPSMQSRIGQGSSVAFEWCQQFVLNSEDDLVLDFVQVVFERVPDDHPLATELNHRFREHGCGYRYEAGEIIRTDSEYLHTEATVPALHLLAAVGFQGPDKEFREAHEHYRHGRGKDALVAANRAFESTMKAICAKQEWPFDEHAQSKQLIKVIFDNGLIPDYLRSKFTGIRTTLESGIPTLRNKRAHGQGKDAQPEPPDWLVAYALHITASAIVMLVRAHGEG